MLESFFWTIMPFLTCLTGEIQDGPRTVYSLIGMDGRDDGRFVTAHRGNYTSTLSELRGWGGSLLIWVPRPNWNQHLSSAHFHSHFSKSVNENRIFKAVLHPSKSMNNSECPHCLMGASATFSLFHWHYKTTYSSEVYFLWIPKEITQKCKNNIIFGALLIAL